MKKLIVIGAAAAALLVTPAIAADLPVKTPVYQAPPPVWSWTGFYIGVNAGGSFGDFPSAVTDATTGGLMGSFNTQPNGFVGGGQIGYNFQFAPNWVLGVEGDFQGTSQKDTACTGAGCADPVDFFYFTIEQKLKWFATARARLGYTNGDWLYYVTGGGAWGEIFNDFRTFTPTDFAFATNFNLSGWVIGGGVEAHLGGSWTAKVEYLYMDLGSFTDGGFDPISAHTFLMTSNVRDQIIRVGLNYKFGSP